MVGFVKNADWKKTVAGPAIAVVIIVVVVFTGEAIAGGTGRTKVSVDGTRVFRMGENANDYRHTRIFGGLTL